MLLCGIDEVGRGPLAGPVTAAAVVLDSPACSGSFPVHLLGDSKALSASKRTLALAAIREQAFLWGVGWANSSEIDSLNILQASHLAMKRALQAACQGLDTSAGGFGIECLVDGNMVPDLPLPTRALVKADATVPAVMAASVLAKEARDLWMIRFASVDQRYGFELHKGYPTRLHRERLALYGPSPIHRRSFRPVGMILPLFDL